MSKYREFWVRFRIGDNESTHQITDVSLNPLGPYKEDFHVVEYSALAAKDAEIAKLKGDLSHYELIIASKSTSIDLLKNELADKDAVLSWYGDKKNWEYWHNSDVGAHKDWNTFRPEVHNGGKRAREVLQKYKGEG